MKPEKMKPEEWFKKNQEPFSGQIFWDEPLSKHTYFRIGGPAKVLVMPKGVEDLKLIAQAVSETGCKYFLMGQGSNLLVSDAGFEGLVVRTQKLNLNIEILDPSAQSLKDGAPLRIRTGGSVAVSTLLRRCSSEGWDGLEFLTGIPGLVGGVIKMNAGTHLGEAVSAVRKVRVYSIAEWPFLAETQVYEGSELRFDYRKNFFLKPGQLVWDVEWEVKGASPDSVKEKIQGVLVRRKSTQPLDYPSCGSVFKNPPKAVGLSAWQVVDKLGLRGHQIGGAQFSEKHSNFILNLGSARASDVRGLIELAKGLALERLGVSLEEEVIYLGF